MLQKISRIFIVSLIGIIFLSGVNTKMAFAGKAANIRIDAEASLKKLYAANPGAKALGEDAVAILVFPSIIKGGFLIGGQYGDGALFKGDEVSAYYRSFAASYGFQAGIQSFGYVLFFMTEDDLAYLDRSDGWEIGVGPTIVVMDEGKASALTTTTLKDGVYAFIFGQKGLMAGVGIQGTKITRIYPM